MVGTMAKTLTTVSRVGNTRANSRGAGRPSLERPTQKRRTVTDAVQNRRSPDHSKLGRHNNVRRINLTPAAQNIIFDVEGTLVDCAFQVTESWRRALQDFGYAFSGPELHKYSGMDTDDMLRVLLPGVPDDEKDSIKNAQARCFRDTFLPTVGAFPGVRALLEKLQRDGHHVALATNCPSEELAIYLALTGAGEFIDVVACGDDKVKGKPHPDLLRLALGRLSARKNAIAVGDTPYDAIAAGRAGIRAIGVMSGGFAMRELEDAGCLAVIGRLPQMLEFV
jgi:phosphoglycolate phosphatase-like HAD superfamily hydrolase